MARNGSLLSHIVTSGDWEAARSVMSYCNVDELDHGGVLTAVVDGSDSETEGHLLAVKTIKANMLIGNDG